MTTQEFRKENRENPKLVCSDCAVKAGGVWPDGHIATFHSNICDVCRCVTTVCSVRNWNYADFGKKQPKKVSVDKNMHTI